MLSHPFSVIGWIVAAVGFLLLLGWVPTDVPAPGLGMRIDPVFNLHKAMISFSVMATGFVMAIVGTIARGFESLGSGANLRPGDMPLAAASAKRPVPAEMITDGDLSKTTWIVTVKDRQGKNRDLRVANDGTVTLDTITGTKVFGSQEEATAYLA